MIHVRTAGRLPDGRDLSRKTRSQGISAGRGSPEAEFMPQVAPRPDEIVLDKPGSGAFTGTGLDELLRNLEIEHVILCGISYDAGVESTLRSATDRGYGLVLVPDACATFDRDAAGGAVADGERNHPGEVHGGHRRTGSLRCEEPGCANRDRRRVRRNRRGATCSTLVCV